MARAKKVTRHVRRLAIAAERGGVWVLCYNLVSGGVKVERWESRPRPAPWAMLALAWPTSKGAQVVPATTHPVARPPALPTQVH